MVTLASAERYSPINRLRSRGASGGAAAWVGGMAATDKSSSHKKCLTRVRNVLLQMSQTIVTPSYRPTARHGTLQRLAAGQHVKRSSLNTPRSWIHRKSIAEAIRDLEQESAPATLKRVLGPLDLVLVGVGVIVGGGIFVVTGNAAAQFAGPAIVLSFLIAGLGCALTGMCYAELAAMIPAAGSAYAFTYTALGEAAAWIIGWNLLLEYVFAASYVSVGWSGYLTSLLTQWGVPLPASLTNAPLAIGPHGLTMTGSLINGPAFLFAAAMALIALRGVRLTSIVNGVIVALKVGALLLV